MSARTRYAALAVATAIALAGLPGIPAGPAAAAGAAGAAGATEEVRPAIRVTRLPGLDGPQGPARVTDVNERGVAVGESVAADGRTTAVRWDGATPTDLTDGAAGTSTRAAVLNDRGAVLGTRDDGAFGGTVVLWEDGVQSDLTDPGEIGRPIDLNNRSQALYGTLAGMFVLTGVVWQDGVRTEAPFVPEANSPFMGIDINERGLAAGYPGNGGQAPFTWRPGDEVTWLPLPDGGIGGVATGLNDRGDVAGISLIEGTPTYTTMATRWRNGRPQPLGSLGGGFSETAWSLEGIGGSPINRAGDVVGVSSTASGASHAFLWRDGTMTDLGTLGGASSRATALNARGQVVGMSRTATGEYHAFAWQDGRMVDLTALAGGGQSTEVTDINDRGQVVGYVDRGDGPVAYRWDLPARL